MAIEMRFAHPEVAWDDIAAKVAVNPSTLWRWRNTEQWEIVSNEVAARYVADLAPDALAGLRRAWKKGNPAGALDVLRALALLRGAELNVTHSMEPDLDAELSRLFGEIQHADSPAT
jgi:hypothetical protein